MSLIKGILLAWGVLWCGSIFAQSKDHIYWSADRDLTWDDFKDKPVTTHPYDAETNWAVEYACDVKGDSLEFTLICYFDKMGSWVKKDKRSSTLLKHEQNHFKLGEIYTRRLRKAFLEFDYKPQTLQRDIQSLYDDMFKDCQEAQQRYDKETNHSKVAEKQEAWNKKIASDLTRLKDYSSHHYKISLR